MKPGKSECAKTNRLLKCSISDSSFGNWDEE